MSLGGVQAEVASPAAGVVARLLAEPGRVVSSGETLAEIAPPAPSPKSAPPPEAEPTREEAPTPVARATPVEMARFRSPAVRRLVALHGLDLEGVEGSGRGGRVTREDVLALLQADAAEPLSGERD